jgi:inorganic triphosphatase YgiF
MEIELKFQVPAAQRVALQRAVSTATVKRTRLQAIYVDTADDGLAAAGLALRLRKEGRVWVQTLKGRGDGLMTRLEHEVTLPAQRGQPTLDPARHAGTPAGDALARALGVAGLDDPAAVAALQPLYRTDIQRLHRTVRTDGAHVEIALDQGWLMVDGVKGVDGADAAGQALRVPVCEIEFELVAGTPAALVALAQRWAQRHRLWWDVRTKSERGFRLARGHWAVPATRAVHQALPAGAGTREFWAAMLQATLAQALPNAAELGSDLSGKNDASAADGSLARGRAEHVHQLRVALRRLRTVLALFAPWGPDADAASALQRAWRAPFKHLGAARDADVLTGTLMRELQAVGVPPLSAPQPPPGEGPGAVVRDPAFTALLLQTLLLSLPPTPALDADQAAPGRKALKAAAAARLDRAWRQVRSDVKHFAALPLPLQHRTRRRLKRLRYAWEFVQDLWPGKPARRWFKALTSALDVLGRYNDLCVAEDHFRSRTDAEPGAWFALGWLAAQRGPAATQSARSLTALAALPRPWR